MDANTNTNYELGFELELDDDDTLELLDACLEAEAEELGEIADSGDAYWLFQ